MAHGTGQSASANAPRGDPGVLLVEDLPEVRKLVASLVRTRGASCDTAGSLEEARRLMAGRRYGLLFVDVVLPDGSGLSLRDGASPRSSADEPLMVVITGLADVEVAVAAVRAGAVDFIPKPFTAGELLSCYDRAYRQWQGRERARRRGYTLETLVRTKSEELRRTSRRVEEVLDGTVRSLGAALNLKDHETADHFVRVSGNSVRLGRRLRLSELELRNLRWGAYLHDIGKIGIHESILLKPGPLSAEERAVMQRHPALGCAMLGNIELLAGSTDVVLGHHERYDGKGYPQGLAAGAIPLHARIFAVLDSLEALTSVRPYRRPSTFTEAVSELERSAGTQLDPEIVEAFRRAPADTWMVQGRVPGTPMLPGLLGTRAGSSWAPGPAAAAGPSSLSGGCAPW